MSSGSSVNDALTDYLAGRATAEQLVATVTAAHYTNRGVGSGEWLRPVIDIIERAHPGFVELRGTTDKPGFAVRLAERPFPKRYESKLREAVQIALGQGIGVGSGVVGARHVVPLQNDNIASEPAAGIWSRIVRAVRRLFIAST